jgi:hypothetical protein
MSHSDAELLINLAAGPILKRGCESETDVRELSLRLVRIASSIVADNMVRMWKDDFSTLFDTYPQRSRDERLELLAHAYNSVPDIRRQFFEGRLVEATIDLPSHPELFNKLDTPCACAECRSYE